MPKPFGKNPKPGWSNTLFEYPLERQFVIWQEWCGKMFVVSFDKQKNCS
jgi:hypothetical protein